MFNIISVHIKIFVLVFLFNINAFATPIPNSNAEQGEGWVLPMILNDNYKIKIAGVTKSRASKINEINQYVLPKKTSQKQPRCPRASNPGTSRARSKRTRQSGSPVFQAGLYDQLFLIC